MTKQELHTALKKKGISFSPSASKAELEKLLNPGPAAPPVGEDDEHTRTAKKGPVHAAAAAEINQSAHVDSAMSGPVHLPDGSVHKDHDIHGKKIR